MSNRHQSYPSRPTGRIPAPRWLGQEVKPDPFWLTHPIPAPPFFAAEADERRVANIAARVLIISMFEADIRPIKRRLLAAGVRRLGVFGSVGRGEARADSDVDVLVRFEDKSRTYDNLYAVGEALEEAFKRRVDLVTEDALSPYLGPRILREVKYVDLGP